MIGNNLFTLFRVIWNSFKLQLKERAVQETFLFTLTIQPIIFTLLSVGIYIYGKKPDFGLFAVTGAGLIGIWNGNLWASGEIVNRERRSGTLSLILATCTPLPVILLGKSIANALTSLLAMGITFATGIVVFRLPLGIENPLAFFTGLLLVVVAFVCLGLMFGSLFVLSRNAGEFVQVANYPVFLLSGLMFPLTILPLWTRPLSFLLAPTWGNLLLNRAAGVITGSLLPSYLWLIGLSILYIAIARLLYRRVEFLALQAGTLEKW